MRRVCVFAGSALGVQPAFAQAATALGTEIARRGWGLVYGASNAGLMGVVARAALDGGGEVIGVQPRGLFRREGVQAGLTEFRETGSMHERKATMSELADAFIALPGGFGTFDELFEIITWAQIGIHEKPIGLLDAAGYFDPLLALIERAIVEGFVPEANRSLLVRATDPATLLDRLAAPHTPAARAANVAPPVEP